MHKTLLALVGIFAAAASAQAQAQDLGNAALSNVTLGNGTLALGGAGLSSSGSLSASRVTAQTGVVTTFGRGVNQNPAGNGGIGGTANGFVETTALSAGGQAVNNTSLTGTGTIQGNAASVVQSGTLGGNPVGTLDNASLSIGARLDGAFQRTAHSNATTGLSGYSGVQLTGPGTVSQQVDGSALSVGASVGGAAGLR